MICKNCNSQNEETMKFCGNCGEKLGEITAEMHSQQAKKNRNGFGLIGFITSICAMIGFGAYTDHPYANEPPLIAVIMFSLLGAAFSIIGLFQKDKKKWQAISGLVISGGVLLVALIAGLILVRW